MNVLLVWTSPRLTLHALLRGAADFANNNLAFEWAEDNQPELDYIDARSALRPVRSTSAGLLAIHIDDAGTMTYQTL